VEWRESGNRQFDVAPKGRMNDNLKWICRSAAAAGNVSSKTNVRIRRGAHHGVKRQRFKAHMSLHHTVARVKNISVEQFCRKYRKL
jgi:hypothetical protein